MDLLLLGTAASKVLLQAEVLTLMHPGLGDVHPQAGRHQVRTWGKGTLQADTAPAITSYSNASCMAVLQ